MIAPGRGVALNGERWVSCRPGFFLPVRVLSRLFRRLFLEKLAAAYVAGQLLFFGACANLVDAAAFAQFLSSARQREWVVYAKRPFGGPEAVLAYLSRYTHRVAISNSRLLTCDEAGVAFRYKDYRADGLARQKVMKVTTDEFIRRFLLHVLPAGFHRIRHYGLLASGARAQNIAHARRLLGSSTTCNQNAPANETHELEPLDLKYHCPSCGGRLIIVGTVLRARDPHAASGGRFKVDTS